MADKAEKLVINTGDADKTYLGALTSLLDVQNASLEFLLSVRRLAKEIETNMIMVTTPLRELGTELNKQLEKDKKAAAEAGVEYQKTEAYAKLEEKFVAVKEKIYSEKMTLKSAKIKLSDFPAKDELAKVYHYQVQNAWGTGLETKSSNYTKLIALIYDELVEDDTVTA